MKPTVHHFKTSREAYDAAQTRDDIRDGDVLVCDRDYVVGVLVKAWPVAVGDRCGEFHMPGGGDWESLALSDELASAVYAEAKQVAIEERAKLGEPPMEYLVGSVNVTFRTRYNGRVRDDDYVRTSIEYDGHLDLDTPPNFRGTVDERNELESSWINYLTEQEIAEWRAIGPEDSELYLTDEWMERLADQLRVLSGGKGWTVLNKGEATNGS